MNNMNKHKIMKITLTLIIITLINTGIISCTKQTIEILPRESKIPTNSVKITPETDEYPPILHSKSWEQPTPLEYPLNTKGAEDSPFITPDGNTIYLFYTPDPNIAPQKQLIDGVTGIYESKKINGQWQTPKRLVLNKDVALDGCEFVEDNIMWFCSARQGNTREIDIYTAEYKNGEWTNWKNAGTRLNKEIGIGELHKWKNKLYYHNASYDIYVTEYKNEQWQEPKPITAVNTELNEGWPYISTNGQELWFTRFYQGTPSIWRALLVNEEWQAPELIISQFAGEPTLDDAGNIYFTHHYYKNGKMIEADIYVAKKN